MSKVLTPIKAIRAKCLECCCNQRQEVNYALSLVVAYTLIAWGIDQRAQKAPQKAQKMKIRACMDKLSMRGGKRLKWQASPLVI